MKKSEINKLKKELKEAESLNTKLNMQTNYLSLLIEKFTGVKGNVDHLTGDGFGFTPESNDDTHIGIDEIIKLAESGQKITEELMLENLSF
jgi:hypothetical protein